LRETAKFSAALPSRPHQVVKILTMGKKLKATAVLPPETSNLNRQFTLLYLSKN
jgi:hypothetical protein